MGLLFGENQVTLISTRSRERALSCLALPDAFATSTLYRFHTTLGTHFSFFFFVVLLPLFRNEQAAASALECTCTYTYYMMHRASLTSIFLWSLRGQVHCHANGVFHLQLPRAAFSFLFWIIYIFFLPRPSLNMRRLYYATGPSFGCVTRYIEHSFVISWKDGIDKHIYFHV